VDFTPQSSRRLTGPNLFVPDQGVVLEAPLPPVAEEAEGLLQAWQEASIRLWSELGWGRPAHGIRHYADCASIACTAPEDVLYTACEALETAWAMAVTSTGQAPAEHLTPEQLQARSAAERSPRRIAIAAAAQEHGVRFLADDEEVTVGSGRGSLSWPVSSLPTVDEIPWDRVSDIPVALITGTNGKTTTVRMLAAIAARAGLTAGNTSTDGVQIGGRTVLEGDYTGGEGARAILRDREIEIAFLEVARGGMLRRGLPVETADVAFVTNVATDHLGEYGIDDLDQLAEVKLLVAKAVRDGGTFVANLDDPRTAAQAGVQRSVACTVGADAPSGVVYQRRHGRLGRAEDGRFVAWLEQAEIPAALAGAALHNVANAVGAMAIATELGISRQAVIDGLTAFGRDAAANPGRCNVFDFGGMKAIIDFAHNPEGLALLLSMASRLRAERRLLVIGQAGDRDNDSIDALADTIAADPPERVILKEMRKYARGRPDGEVVSRLRDRLTAAGYAAERMAVAADELTAMRDALAWGRPGDVLLLTSHAQRDEALQLLQTMKATGWLPGDTLPPDRDEENNG
jgi:UDP-N-acetylmuramyl tripeptide synthase